MKTPRIYSADEARTLCDGTTPGPWFSHRSIDEYTEILSAEHGQVVRLPEDDMVSVCVVDHNDIALLAAAPDLAASVEHHAARADELSAECVKLRVAWVRETHRSDDATARADAAEAALAAAHARIADLERLAAGPRTPAVDDGLARPFAPETLHKLEHEPGWDADGREVSR